MENRVPLHSTGNYIKYPGINIMEKNIKKNVYITESLRCTAEINTYNIVNQLYLNKKFFSKKKIYMYGQSQSYRVTSATFVHEQIIDFMCCNYLNKSYSRRRGKLLPYIQAASLLYLQMRVT